MEKVWKIKGHQVMKGKGNDRKFLCVKGNANSLLKEKYSIEKLTKFSQIFTRTYHGTKIKINIRRVFVV